MCIFQISKVYFSDFARCISQTKRPIPISPATKRLFSESWCSLQKGRSLLLQIVTNSPKMGKYMEIMNHEGVSMSKILKEIRIKHIRESEQNFLKKSVVCVAPAAAGELK